MLALTCASLATFSLCFLTPSRMCPMSTLLMACAKVVQLIWFSGIFSLNTSGSSSRTLQRPLVDVSIFAHLAKSRIFSAKTMCMYTSSPLYFSVFPSSSIAILITPNSLSSSGAVFVAFLMFGNLVLNSCSSSSQVFFGVFTSLYHSSASESLFRYSSKRLFFCSSVVVPMARNECLIILRKSDGWVVSS